jgi:predicted alpha/beta hydrolase family esterase
MNFPTQATILMVPGLRDHVEDHWQTLLEAKLTRQQIKVRAVPPLEHDRLSRDARVAALDAALAAIDGPVFLVAHSAGSMITVHWAQDHQRRIEGALLVTPADLENPLPPGYPVQSDLRANGWEPIPRIRLPFPTIVAASTNDPLATFERVAQFAKDWGSHLVKLGEVGHLNPATGYGEWLGAEPLIEELVHMANASPNH